MFVNPNLNAIPLSSPDKHHFYYKTPAPNYMELKPGTDKYLNGKELTVGCTTCADLQTKNPTC
ncbi:unnamed protein product [Meloidogyne enterolobii]|uniref:Uncharacterized protein n=1 Tax=Meloidogyne enterolobii TaxID=390850 RepID=A0ACB1AHL2_MELEN